MFRRRKKEEFASPMQGTIMNLDDVKDQAFSSRAMGDGFAIEVTDDKVCSPLSGEIILCFPSKHAYGIRAYNGVEILLHIGMDTVELNGNGFISHVNVGDKIVQGDVIAEVDIDYIINQKKSLVSPVIFTSGEKIQLKKVNTIVSLAQKDIIEIRKN